MTQPNASGLVALHEDHVEPAPTPVFLRPLFPDGPVGPWTWRALEDARSRHLAALEAVEAAREANDPEAEREAIAEVCASVIDGCHAIGQTVRSAQRAYREAVESVKQSLPTDQNGVVPSSETARYRAMARKAAEWTDPDLRALRRCLSLTEADHFYGGRTVPSIVLQVEQFRAMEADETEDLGEAVFEAAKETDDLAA